jgi:prepilin-type N-terminal cleavage/methylation domain
MNKKGFTLMEILVVVLIVVILVSMFSLTYKKNVGTRNNERARALLVELANAAKLYNEMNPNHRIYGGFGDNPPSAACPGCVNPCVLFRGSSDDEVMTSYALKPREWGISNAAACGNTINYQGYVFYICNPNYDDQHTTQPNAACVFEGTPRFAVMTSPNNAPAVYNGGHAWITLDYRLENNYLYTVN